MLSLSTGEAPARARGARVQISQLSYLNRERRKVALHLLPKQVARVRFPPLAQNKNRAFGPIFILLIVVTIAELEAYRARYLKPERFVTGIVRPE